ncbi:MAG: MFS transporter, partial [Aestuariivirga sp.]
IMIGGGFIGFALGTWQAHYITSDWAFWELFMPQILRGVSLMMCMVTVTNIALGTLTPVEMRGGSGLFNLTRNLGGAVGLALINTVMNQRFDLHLQRLHEAVSFSSNAATTQLQDMTYAFHRLGSNAGLVALKQMSLIVRRQAFTMAIADIFYILTVLFLAIVLMLPLLQKPKPVGAAAGGGH